MLLTLIKNMTPYLCAMLKSFCIACLFTLLNFTVADAQLPKDFYLLLKDNISLVNVSNDYKITSDSLIITGDSDFGRKRVRYLTRLLSKKEKKEIAAFFKKFDLNKLEDIYINEPNHEQMADEVRTYRIIQMEGQYKKTFFRSSMQNCFSSTFVSFINLMNKFVPGEVRIRVYKEDFNADLP